MHLCISPKLNLPWDDSSDSYFTDPETDNDTLSITLTNSTTSNTIQHPSPVPTNPYQAGMATTLHTQVMTTLHTWIQPRPPPPINPTIAHPRLDLESATVPKPISPRSTQQHSYTNHPTSALPPTPQPTLG